MRLLALAILAACGGPAPTARPDGPPAASCAQLEQGWYDVLATIDTSCNTATDCVVLGGAFDCEGSFPTLGGCLGVAVNGASLAQHQQDLDVASNAWTPCSSQGCTERTCCFDETAGIAACDNGTCTVHSRFFCNASPDAGVPDGGP